MSCSSSFGRYSTMELASMDLPVPGSPISMTCLFWEAALRMTSTASSWPMTLSAIRSGIWICSVEVKVCLSAHSSTERSHLFTSDLFDIVPP